MGDRVNIVFSHDVTLCGWLGSKYQLTNLLIDVNCHWVLLLDVLQVLGQYSVRGLKPMWPLICRPRWERILCLQSGICLLIVLGSPVTLLPNKLTLFITSVRILDEFFCNSYLSAILQWAHIYLLSVNSLLNWPLKLSWKKFLVLLKSLWHILLEFF